MTWGNDVVLNVTTYRLTMILWSLLRQRFFIYKEQTLRVMICLVIWQVQRNYNCNKFLGSFAKAQMSLSMHWKFCSLSLTLWNDVVLNVATYRLTMISRSLLRQRFFIYKEQALKVMICVKIRHPWPNNDRKNFVGSFSKAQMSLSMHWKFCSLPLTLRNDVASNGTTYKITMKLWSLLRQTFFIYKEQALRVMICLAIRHLQTNIDRKKFLGSFAKVQPMHFKFCPW